MSQKNTKLILYEGVDWHRGVAVASRFNEEYPDRVGIHDCVVYSRDNREALIVYRTKKGAIVVRP